MLKYRGTYRVLFEIDKRTGKPCEFTYIPCRIRKGSNICRHNADTLDVYIPGIKTAYRILRTYPEVFRLYKDGDCETILLFAEKDIEKVAIILKARIMGKNMNPKPKRRIVFSDDQKKILSDRLRELHKRKESLNS